MVVVTGLIISCFRNISLRQYWIVTKFNGLKNLVELDDNSKTGKIVAIFPIIISLVSLGYGLKEEPNKMNKKKLEVFFR